MMRTFSFLPGMSPPRNSGRDFSQDWAQLVDKFGTLKSNASHRHFHMNAMAKSPERMEWVKAFHRCIEKYADVSLCCALRVDAVPAALDRIGFKEGARLSDWGQYKSPYFWAFNALMDSFHSRRGDIQSFDIGQRVDFIFDELSEKRQIIENWDAYLARKTPEIRELYGANSEVRKGR